MTQLTSTSNIFQQYRVLFREKFKEGLRPDSQRKPIEDGLAKYLVQSLIDAGVPKDGLIGVFDSFLILCTHLKEAGFTNLVLLESSQKGIKLTRKQKEYYNWVKTICEKSKIKYYTIPNNSINRCKMNFSAALGNPAYTGQLHLQFLSGLLKKSEVVRLVHPSGWLTRNGKKEEKEVKNDLKGRLSKLTLFTGICKFPTAQFQCPLVITEANKCNDGKIEVFYENSGNTYFIDSLDDFPTGYWEPTPVNCQLKELYTQEANKSNLLSLRTCDGSKVPLNLPTVCGDFRSTDPKQLARNDTYLFYYPNSKIYTHENNEGKFYSLNSEEERENLLSYLKTKFARFALALNKATNRNNVSRYIVNTPLPPLDREWTEESIMDYYRLTQDQRDSINSFLPDYY